MVLPLSTMRQLGTIERCLKFSVQCDDVRVDLGLMVAVNPAETNKVGVKAQVLTIDSAQVLPMGLQFKLWSQGEILQDRSVVSHTRFLELPYFRGMEGETFMLEIRLGKEVFQTNFQM
jgi:hypothetical protein